MEMILQRDDENPQRTLGRLSIDGHYVCHVLEDPVRDGPKVQDDTAIPVGRYEVVISFSQRFHRLMPEILDVPGFIGIRIHGGNTTADTRGCPLVGRVRRQDSVHDCAPALADVMTALKVASNAGEKSYISVRNAPMPGAVNV